MYKVQIISRIHIHKHTYLAIHFHTFCPFSSCRTRGVPPIPARCSGRVQRRGRRCLRIRFCAAPAK